MDPVVLNVIDLHCFLCGKWCADEATYSSARCVIHLIMKMKYQNSKRIEHAKMVPLEMRKGNSRAILRSKNNRAKQNVHYKSTEQWYPFRANSSMGTLEPIFSTRLVLR